MKIIFGREDIKEKEVFYMEKGDHRFLIQETADGIEITAVGGSSEITIRPQVANSIVIKTV